MTALRKYTRLEASGVWCPAEGAQRRDVIVSVGNASLVISDNKDQPLAHWSLAAIARDGTGTPAIYYPDGDSAETLELPAEESEMIDAIETLRKAVTRARPHPGRLRLFGALASVAVVAAVAIFWVPPALVNHALRVLPDVNRAAIGRDLLNRVTRVSGPACTSPGAYRALSALATRTGVSQVIVVQDGVRPSLYLPGGTVLLNRSVVEDYEEPDVAAGYVIAAATRWGEDGVMRAILQPGGVRASISLLTTGDVPAEALDRFLERQAAETPAPLPPETLLTAFAAADVRSTPYAYAQDISGETTLELIEGDPMINAAPEPIMRDADWLRLQSICDGG